MKPKLPRALLWTDIESMDEFLKAPVNQEMYDLFLKIKQRTMLLKNSDYAVIKIFHEVYYQCTRIVYEQEPNIRLKDYITDIKSNMGTYNHARVIYGLIFFLFSRRKNNTLIEKQYCSSFFLHFCMCDDKGIKGIFNSESYDPENKYSVDLSPRPNPTSQLDKFFIHWKDVTNDFNKECIVSVCKLYSDIEEIRRVYGMIRNSCLAYSIVNNKPMKNMFPFNYDEEFRYLKYKYCDYHHIYNLKYSENEPPISPTYQELEKENQNLKKKLEAALSENESLKSKLNMTKPKRQQETSFTVSMIVDYCKRIPEYQCVEAIEKMLYKFIKMCTEKEEKLIDSISEHFNNKKYGDTVMGDKNDFYGNSGLNQIALPPGMTPQEAIKLLQAKDNKKNGKERKR